MAVLAGKAMDLVLDAGAVTRPYPFDHSGVHRRTIQAATDDVVGLAIGMRDPARQLLRVLFGTPQEGEHRHRIEIARLLVHHGEIDGASVDTRRRTRLQAALRQLELLQARRKRYRGRVTRTAASVVIQPHVDLPVEEGASGQYHGACAKGDANLRDGTDHAVALHHQVIHGLLEQHQVGLVFEPRANRLAIQHAVRLSAGGTYGRTLAGIQDTKLDPRLIRGCRHGAAHCIHLLDEMALANAADGRIAAHLTKGLDVVAQQQCLAAHTRSGECSFSAGVAATDNNDIELFWVKHGGTSSGRLAEINRDAEL